MKITLVFLSVLLTCTVHVFSQQCRSYSRLQGYCVSITTCPPLFTILQNRPTVQQLRQLQRLTCGFENSDPKVCCPTKSIDPPLDGEGTRERTTTEKPKLALTTNKEEDELRNLISTISSDDRRSGNLRNHPNFRQIPKLKQCSEALVTDRVVGGKEADHGKYPWMARIGYQKGSSSKITYYCAGSVINKRYILTAAHCTEGLQDYIPKTIRLGEFDVRKDTDCNTEYGLCSKADDYNIEKITGHKNYSTSTKQNDISLIRVDRDITFNSYFIKPVCLPFYKEYGIENLAHPPPNGRIPKPKAVVAGWGRTDPNRDEGSDRLLEVSLPLKTNAECRSIYSKRVSISKEQICAGGEAGMDSCGGDSGGPLVAPVNTNETSNPVKLFQLGVVSYGPVNCGAGGLPGVYARVSQYLKWILDNIEP